MSLDPQLLHQKVRERRSKTKPRSRQTDKVISRLKEEGLEILNSQLDRQTVIIWIWCYSQAATENTKKLYESNRLTDLFFDFGNIAPPISEIIKSKVINMDSSQFNKTVGKCLLIYTLKRELKI